MNYIYPIRHAALFFLCLAFFHVPTQASYLHSQVDLKLKAAPDNTINISVNSDSICVGETISIYLDTSETGVEYQLTSGGNNIDSPILGTGSQINFTLSPNSTVTYQVVATNTSTSESSVLSQSVTITVNPGPDLDKNITFTYTVICKGEGVVISLENSDVGFDYLLNNGPDDFPPSISGSGSDISFPKIFPESNTIYQVFVSSPNCFDKLKMNQTAIIDVSPAPNTDLIVDVNEANVCPGEEVILTVEASQIGTEYQIFDGSAYVTSTITGNGKNIQFLLFPTTSELYTVRAFGEDCLSYYNLDQKALVTVGTEPRTDIVITSDKNELCLGESVIIGLQESENGISYQLTDGTNPIGSPLNGDGNAISFPQLSPVDTTTYYVEAKASSCSEDKMLDNSKSIIVHAQPNKSLPVTPANAAVCDGESISVFVENSETDVSYQIIEGTSPIGNPMNGTGGTIEFEISPSGSVTYEVQAIRNTCSTQVVLDSSLAVTVSSLPNLDLNLIANPDEICEDENSVISLDNSETGVEYQLRDLSGSIGSALTGTGGQIDFPAISPILSNSYFVDAIKVGCSSVYPINSQADIIVNPKPNSTITFGIDTDTICAGEIIVVTIFTSEPDISYEVLGSADGLLGTKEGNGTDISIFTKPLNSQSIQIQARNIVCSTPVLYPDTVNIVVNPGPKLDLNVVTDYTEICESLNTPVSISVEDSENGLSYWLKDDSGTTISSASGNGGIMGFPSVSPDSSTIYIIETTMPGCFGRLALENSVVLNVIPLPSKDISLSITEPEICVGENTIISLDTSELGVNYQLFDGTYLEGDPVAGTGDSLAFPEFSPSSSVYYQVIATNETCNTTDTLSENIRVVVGLQPKKNLHPTIDKHTVCEGEEVIISLTPTDPTVEYQLFDENTPIGNSLTGTSEKIQFNPTIPIISTTYRIEALGEKCLHPIDIRYTVDVDVHHQPLTDKILISDRDTICMGEEIIFSIENSESDILYQLHNGINLIEPNVVGNGGRIEFPVQQPDVNSTYQIYAHENTCTEQIALPNSKSITVLNFSYLSLESFATPDEICLGEAIDIELPFSTDGVEYILQNGDSELNSIIGNGNAIVFEDIVPDENSLLQVAISNCKQDLIVAQPNYSIHTNPKLQILTTDVQDASGGDLIISVSDGTSPYTYIIEPGETITSESNILELKNQQTGTYQILVVDGNACRSSDAGELAEIKIDEDLQVIVNNAITPNGDGINDEWLIQFNPELKAPEVFIFNIYGQKIFHAKSYQNNWKGSYNGSILPNGAYYYLINFESEQIKPIRGTLSILGNY